MDKAALAILERLKAAKIPAALRERTRALIDEARDFDPTIAAEVGAAVDYVCGLAPSRPVLSKPFLERHASRLLRGLSSGRTLDDWDLRAFDLLALAKGCYWFWELDTWLRGRVEAFPDQPVFDEALELWRARGLWRTDAQVIDSLVGHLSAHLSERGEPTSAGRWLLGALDRDAEAVFARAQAHRAGGKTKDRRSRLYRLLLAARPALFEALLPTLTLAEDSDRSFLAQVLLEHDAARFEARAVELVDGLSAPLPCVMSARNLERAFPGKYRPLVKRLLCAALAAKDASFTLEGKSSSTHKLAYQLAWPALGAEAIEVWSTYREENDALRLDFYATIEKQAKAAALPLLVDGLCYPKDPTVEYGFVTHAKYVARLAALVKRYDLTPHRERIAATFAGTRDRKIREEIDRLLGAPGGRAKPSGRRRTAARGAGEAGYDFDVYGAALKKAALAALRKATLPEPLELLKLTGEAEAVLLEGLVVEGQGETLALELAPPTSRIPAHVDQAGADALLDRFCQRHGLGEDEDEAPVWGDMLKLPWCVLLHEQIETANAVVAALKKRGVRCARGLRVGVGEHDSFWTRADGFGARAREEVAALPEEQQADFAALCYQGAARRRWLLGGR